MILSPAKRLVLKLGHLAGPLAVPCAMSQSSPGQGRCSFCCKPPTPWGGALSPLVRLCHHRLKGTAMEALARSKGGGTAFWVRGGETPGAFSTAFHVRFATRRFGVVQKGPLRSTRWPLQQPLVPPPSPGLASGESVHVWHTIPGALCTPHSPAVSAIKERRQGQEATFRGS